MEWINWKSLSLQRMSRVVMFLKDPWRRNLRKEKIYFLLVKNGLRFLLLFECTHSSRRPLNWNSSSSSFSWECISCLGFLVFFLAMFSPASRAFLRDTGEQRAKKIPIHDYIKLWYIASEKSTKFNVVIALGSRGNTQCFLADDLGSETMWMEISLGLDEVFGGCGLVKSSTEDAFVSWQNTKAKEIRALAERRKGPKTQNGKIMNTKISCAASSSHSFN